MRFMRRSLDTRFVPTVGQQNNMIPINLVRFHLLYNELTPLAFWGGFFTGLVLSFLIGLLFIWTDKPKV
jgi:hypothetical protein